MADWMRQLKTTHAGLGFDGQFMARMLLHHEMAIIEAAASEGRLAHQQLAYVLGTVVHSQQVQVSQMSTWLQTWYSG